jgi:hypothetical protein
MQVFKEERSKNMNPVNILLNAIEYLNESDLRDEDDIESIELIWQVLRELEVTVNRRYF